MALSEQEFSMAKTNYFPSLEAFHDQGKIERLRLRLLGVVGNGNKTQIEYQVLVTIDGYPQHAPIAYIEWPRDAEIRHVNIYKASGSLLPRICVGRFDEGIWQTLPDTRRRLMDFLLELHYVLLNENHNSRARTP